MRIAYPPELPVSARRDDLLEAIGSHQVVVVAGETGSGKTTQLPKLCLELGRTAIAHTQPRRIAARSVAERIAFELGVPLGDVVGYAVRFDDRSRRDSSIRVVTDGLLLAEIQHDRLLRRYDTIIVDEAHERSLNIDFLLGYVKSILPRRPDLKLIVTSATIDPERFARHFGDAPVVEVSGRTYPVDVRYSPVADGGDPLDAIGDAVASLTPLDGDVLVFLSGEREIRDAADLLGGRLGDEVEIVPLYARLSAGEQSRVFDPGPRARVVLATNVAETSLTVPRIKYVVDPGTARISRYSARLKVQRLPIEPVSQASADQRKGRCGRVGPGVCVRLYSEEDFSARPRFTDPEILRTSLAAVILQMAASRLGDIEDFPFLDPPDRRQVSDGLNLLHELGALGESRHLTPLGRRLAALPVDPRLGRMVLEADRRDCADEVIVIAAALSIQDPRERPADRTAEADASHARFEDPSSDFLAYLNLWRYVRDERRALSSNQFRKRCRAEFLHYLRVREWQDLAGQLRSAARRAGVRVNAAPGSPEDVHRALLAGLLSHVGVRAEREYVGARDARFVLWPGSSLARKGPPWVMVAELVETSRLFGRVAARVDPRWIEPVAQHLVKRSYGDARWDRGRAAAVVTERVTLYGLPIVAGRTVPYARVDAAAARETFIRNALVAGDWDARHEFLRRNAELRASVEAVEERARRRDILVDDSVLFEFFDARVPAEVVSGAGFDRWWRDQPDGSLDYTRELLTRADASLEGRPDAWKQGDLVLRLSYRFEPGSERDGVTAHVPLRVLGALRDEGFDWLVPALREELVVALIRSLPKELRRQLVPAPEVAAAVVPLLRPRRGRFVEAVAAALSSLRPVRVPADAFDTSRLPPHLRMRFRVEDHRGAVLAEGDDLADLRRRLTPKLRADLSDAARGLERTGLTSWDGIGELPRAVALPGTGGAVRAYPALVDEGASVGVKVLDTPAAQQEAMRLGTRRLLLLTVPLPSPRPPLQFARHGDAAALVADCVAAAADALVAEAGGPAWTAAAFDALRTHVASELHPRTDAVVAQVARILDAEREVTRRMESLTADALRPVVDDVAAQLRRLLPPGFVSAAGAARLPDLERYLDAAARRLERAPSALAADLDRMKTLDELESHPRAAAVRWELEELRVAQFAQSLARGGVSVKKLRRLLDTP